MDTNLKIPSGRKKWLVKSWLLLAISSLAMAGIYSLPPVILRGPFFAGKFDIEHVFATSLVVHVDLSVLFWFLSIGGMLWSFLASEKLFTAYRASFYVAATGMAIISLSPFIGDTMPLKNNYIPVLQNFSFFLGLSLFACGIIFQVCLTLTNYKNINGNLLSYGIYYSALITAIALACFVISHNSLTPPPATDPHDYYEALFWGGGHVLQFTYVTLTLIAWLWLADISGLKNPLPPKFIIGLLALNFLVTAPSPAFYMAYDHISLFAGQMKYFAGIAALIIGASIIYSALGPKSKTEEPSCVKACLLLSILLFGYGGLLGYMISGVNVTIPAHYHGSIVAVTLSFMGLAYYLLPKLGFGEIKGRTAAIQPYIYGIGQVMHITGLAWMGGYGALRKAAGSSQNVHALAPKLLFFSGGSLAILGGLLFVVVTARVMFKKKKF